MLSYFQVHLWAAPQSLATVILNAFSDNKFEIDFKHSDYSTLIAEMINTIMHAN